MEGSSKGDAMDWTPTNATTIYYSPLNVAGRRRKFDEIVDERTRYGREMEYEYQRYGSFGDDSNMGIIPRYGRRAALTLFRMTCLAFIIAYGFLGTPIDYTAATIKRRLIGNAQDWVADNRATTPRRRKYRNMYLTPRQAYEQRSATSCKIRDIPGRFPGSPLTCYNAKSTSPRGTPSTSKNTLSPDMRPLPGSYPESPLQGKCERQLWKKKAILHQATTQSVIQSQQTATEVNNAPPLDPQNKPLSIDGALQDQNRHSLSIAPRWEEVSELEESIVSGLPTGVPMSEDASGIAPRWEDVSELEDSEVLCHPAEPPTVDIASGVREFGQAFVDEAPIMRHLPEPESRAEEQNHITANNVIKTQSREAGGGPHSIAGTVSPNTNRSRPILSLSPGPINERRSEPGQVTYEEIQATSKISKKPRSAIARKEKPASDGPFGIMKIFGSFRLRNPHRAPARKSVGFFESPKTGCPVTCTRRFADGETLDSLSPTSTSEESGLPSNHSPRSALHYQSRLDVQLQPNPAFETGSRNYSIGGGDFSIDLTSEGGSAADTIGKIFSQESPDEIGSNSHSATDGEISVDSTGEQGRAANDVNDDSTARIKERHNKGSQSQNTDGEEVDSPEKATTSKTESMYIVEPIDDDSDKSSESKEDITGDEKDSPEQRKQRATGNIIRQRGRKISKVIGKNSSSPNINRTSARLPLSNEASISSLYGQFEDLGLAPRRSSIRQLELAEKNEIAQAALEKKTAEEKAQCEKEAAELYAQFEREHEQRLIKQGVRRFTKEPIIQPLTAEQDDKLAKAMAKGQRVNTLNGVELTSRDWKTVLPHDGWLNDNIIVAYLDYVVKMAHERAGLKRNDPPKMHAFNNNFYNNLRTQGYNSVAKWTRRPKIKGKALLPLEYVFIPVNATGNHWTLAVISPIRRTIEYFDSLQMPGQANTVIALMRVWLQGELGDAYIPDEWTVREDEGPHQGNFSDCGVHTITTAKMIALCIDPMAAPAKAMPTQRKRIVAELLNSGFHGEFEVDFEFA